MGADFRAFFDDADSDFSAFAGTQLHQPNGCTEAGRASAHDDDVEFHRFSFHNLPRLVERCALVISIITEIHYNSSAVGAVPMGRHDTLTAWATQVAQGISPELRWLSESACPVGLTICIEFRNTSGDTMKALVAVKRVVDYNVKVRAKADGSDVDLNNVKMAINPFCEIAVEEAVRLKEAGTVSEIIAVSVGESSCQEQIRTALALGADRGIHVEVEGKPEPLSIAKLLKGVIEKESPDLVIMGKQSIDGDNNQTGQMLGALTGMGQGTFASEIKIADGAIEVIREVDGGLQTVALTLPAIITTDLRLNEPRYASLPNIMKAKKKPLDTYTPEDLSVAVTSHVTQVSVAPPPERAAGIKVEDVAQLVDKLKNEAKVIS